MLYRTKGFEIREKKCAIREEYRQKRRALAADRKQESDARICSLFLQSITYRYAETLFLYAPLPDEIDIMPIARQALADGKTVAFPRCDDRSCTMQYHRVRDLSELVPGAYGISEPPEDAPVLSCQTEAAGGHPVCIVPGLVFDGDGYRVGYGKGYYDRYLADFAGVRVGMVYADFVLPRIPRGRFDLSVDVLVTEKGVRAVHAE